MTIKWKYTRIILNILLGIAFLTGIGHTFPIPDSGQISSYTMDFGEDCDYSINMPNYTKLDANGNALNKSASTWVMVRDEITGLIWEVKTTDNSIHGNARTATWYDSNNDTNGGFSGTNGEGTDTEDYLLQLNFEKFGGFSDWRLPTLQEISTIVAISKESIAISKSVFPNAQAGKYWTSTTNANYPNKAWYVNLVGGGNGNTDKSEALYIRAVRKSSTILPYHFVESTDNTIIDTKTGLMWQKNDTGQKFTWEQAINASETLVQGGYNDWRMPSREELRSIVNYNAYAPSRYSAFIDMLSDNYWSSTVNPYNNGYIWCITFYNGYDNYQHLSSFYYMRAVRGGQKKKSGSLFITSPKQGSSWPVYATMPITWETQSITGTVDIGLSRDGSAFQTIATTDNDGSYDWTVTGNVSYNCAIKITPVNDPSKTTMLDIFSIIPNEIPVLSISPTSRNAIILEGTTTFSVINDGPGTMNWTAVPQNTWLTIDSGQSGTNNGTIVVRYNPNPGNARVGSVLISSTGAVNSPQTVYINQDAGHPILSISPETKTVNGSAGSTSIMISNTGTTRMDWVASSQASWLTFVGDYIGTNDGLITLYHNENPGEERTGTIIISASNTANSPKTITITQASGHPKLSVVPLSRNMKAYEDLITSFAVANSGTGLMGWTATANNDWLTIISGFSGTNTGNVYIRCTPNSGAERTGTITIKTLIGGDSLTVQIIQEAGYPVLNVTPGLITVSGLSGVTSFTVTNSGAGTMQWSIDSSSLPSWMTIISDSSGTDSGTFKISYTENPGVRRTGSFIVNAPNAGNSPKTIHIIQDEKIIYSPPSWIVEPRLYQYQCTITGVVYDKNGLERGEANDLFGAFVGDECRGYAIPSTTEYGIRYFVQIWSNSSTGELVQFKFFDSSTGKIYDQFKEIIVFQANTSFGTVKVPYSFITTAIDLTIPVKKGWNWISFNVRNDDMSLKTIFTSVSDYADRVVGQEGFSEYYSGKWFGTLTQINPYKLYMLKMTADDTLELLGNPIQASEVNITLSQGWNWISYIPNQSLSTNEALKSINNNGLLIVGQNGYAEFYNSWWGSLQTLYPGQGYQLKMVVTDILSYPIVSTRKNAPLVFDSKNSEPLISSQYQYQFAVTAIVSDSYGHVNTCEDSYIIATMNHMICGQSSWIKTPEGGRHFLQIWGDQPDTSIQFEFFDAQLKKKSEIETNLIFKPHSAIGSIKSPVQLDLQKKSNPDDDMARIILSLQAVANQLTIVCGCADTNMNNKIDLIDSLILLKRLSE